MDKLNGDKSKIIFFLLGLIQAAILGWFWKIDNGMAATSNKVARLEAYYENIDQNVKDIKDMLKRYHAR